MKKILFCAAVCTAMIACNDNAKTDNSTVATTDTSKPVVTETPAETPAPPMDSAAMMKAWEAYMKPGEEHKMIAASNGKWDEEVTFYMSPDAPPETMKATCENSMIHNGLYQVSLTKGMYNGMPFEGRSTLGFNNASKKYQTTWIDNMGSGIMMLEGTYDAATKTMNLSGKQTDPMTGKEMAIRETVKMIDDKNQYMEMFETRGGKEAKTMEIKLTKK